MLIAKAETSQVGTQEAFRMRISKTTITDYGYVTNVTACHERIHYTNFTTSKHSRVPFITISLAYEIDITFGYRPVRISKVTSIQDMNANDIDVCMSTPHTS